MEVNKNKLAYFLKAVFLGCHLAIKYFRIYYNLDNH